MQKTVGKHLEIRSRGSPKNYLRDKVRDVYCSWFVPDCGLCCADLLNPWSALMRRCFKRLRCNCIVKQKVSTASLLRVLCLWDAVLCIGY
jgi:hypothetical protein